MELLHEKQEVLAIYYIFFLACQEEIQGYAVIYKYIFIYIYKLGSFFFWLLWHARF